MRGLGTAISHVAGRRTFKMEIEVLAGEDDEGEISRMFRRGEVVISEAPAPAHEDIPQTERRTQEIW